MRQRATGASTRLLLCLLMAGIAGNGCTKAVTENKESASGTAGPTTPGPDATGDDDLVVVESVPMNLLDPSQLANLGSELGAPSAGSFADLGAAARRGYEAGSQVESRLELASSIVAAPGRAAGEMAALLGELRSAFAKIFGAGSFFGNGSLAIKGRPADTRGARLFRLPDSIAEWRYAEVGFDRSRTEFPYQVVLFTVDAANALTSVVIDFAMPTPERLYNVRVQRRAGAGGEERFLDIDYASNDGKLRAVFGPMVPVSDRPARTLLQFSLDDATRISRIEGAYTWRRPSSEKPGDVLPPPRYYVLESGDIEAFRGVMRAEGGVPLAQELAFVPQEDLAAVGVNPGAALFASRPYDALLMSFLVHLVRRADVNPDCASAGERFRAGFGANPQPASVSSAPNDLCRENAAVADTVVAAILSDTCEAGVPITLPLSIKGVGTVDYAICDKYLEAYVLRNPQFLETVGGVRKVLVRKDVSSEHKALAAMLGKSDPFPSLDSLTSLTVATLGSRPLADFTAAEAAP